jgi:hypothetical protein
VKTVKKLSFFRLDKMPVFCYAYFLPLICKNRAIAYSGLLRDFGPESVYAAAAVVARGAGAPGAGMPRITLKPGSRFALAKIMH